MNTSVRRPLAAPPPGDHTTTPAADAANTAAPSADDRDPFLVALGERLRALRARHGLTRKALALASDVSERHLANLELGVGNVSVLVLRQIAHALHGSIADLLEDESIHSPERQMILDLLRDRNEEDLRRARRLLAEALGEVTQPQARTARIALIGLRGAGKSTLGARLAEALGIPFVELTREIERVAGCGLAEVHNLLGPTAYRRYEHRALEETIQLYPDAVIATPGGLVSEAANLNLLLAHCHTIWLQASPEEHMQRVIAQGDLRPIAGNHEAMADLRRILAERAAYYGKADQVFSTSQQTPGESVQGLLRIIESARQQAAEGRH